MMLMLNVDVEIMLVNFFSTFLCKCTCMYSYFSLKAGVTDIPYQKFVKMSLRPTSVSPVTEIEALGYLRFVLGTMHSM